MSTVGPRQHSSVRQKVPIGKVPVGRRNAQKEEKEDKMTEIAPSAAKLFAFTIDANTARIVKLETLDASGSRHELSEEEKASLAREESANGLEDVVERAFEAGIACVLGGEEPQEKTEESAEDAELRHMLLTPLIEHSPAKRLIEREALTRAILGTLIQHATKPAADAESSSTAGLPSDRAASARAN